MANCRSSVSSYHRPPWRSTPDGAVVHRRSRGAPSYQSPIPPSLDRLLQGPDGHLRVVVCVRGARSRPTLHRSFERDGASDRSAILFTITTGELTSRWTGMLPPRGLDSHRPSARSFKFHTSVACITTTSVAPPDRRTPCHEGRCSRSPCFRSRVSAHGVCDCPPLWRPRSGL